MSEKKKARYLAPGSIEEAAAEMPDFPELSPEETRIALHMSRLILYYVYFNSAPVRGSADSALRSLIMTFLERLPLLAFAGAADWKFDL